MLIFLAHSILNYG